MLLFVFFLSACGKANTNNSQMLNTEEIEQETQTQESTETEDVTESQVVESEQTEVPSETPSETPSEEPSQPVAPEMESWASGYYVYDPHNTRGLSNEKKGYVYGVAANGQCNAAALNAQKYFDGFGGLKALAVDTKTTEKVLYLTFSSGYEYNNNTVKILDILKEKNVKAAFFGELGYFKDNPHLTKRFIEEGHILGNHTATHPDFPTLSRDNMASQVYRVDKYLKDTYGYECRYFRYPGGYYSENSLDLVAGLGHRVVFWSTAYRDWDKNELRGADYSFETVTSRLHPGAVIVLHTVNNDNVEALGAIIDYAREQGYVFKTLDDYPW